MKISIYISAIIFLISSLIFYSSNIYPLPFFQNKENYDTIVKKSGVKIEAKIVKRNKFEIIYLQKGSKNYEKISNDVVKEIRFSNGKIELIGSKAGKLTKEQADKFKWSDIIVANDDTDLSGLVNKGEIECEYIGNSLIADDGSLERNCIILLKKKASSMQGHVIKVTSKKIIREYGEYPRIIMKADMYVVE